ncbi:MAG: PspC domain-containing protein [bacterium]
MERKLYLAEQDKKFAGVCGGIGEYLGVDSTVVRLLWVLFTLAYGSGIFGYIICMFLIPRRTEN